MLYQSQHSLRSDYFMIERGQNFSFPPHLHSSFEFIAVPRGEMVVTVEKKEYILRDGDALLIFPNQLHSLRTNTSSEHILCIFSPQLVRAYGNIFLNKSPKSNLFTPAKFYIDELSRPINDGSVLRIKGLLYSLCAEFDRSAEYTEKVREDDGLLLKIFGFVEKNYAKECSLRMLAEEISYHEVYLSRYFKKSTGLTFTEYVNRYRVNEGAYILTNSQKKIVDVAYECGFDSLRSFNRSFKAIIGTTPKSFRGQGDSRSSLIINALNT